MSWLATKYAWKCRHEDVKGSVRLVLLALALRVRKHYISTVPTSYAVLTRLTFLSDDTLKRCIDTLIAAGEVQRTRRGKRAVYALIKLAGPLFSESPQDAVFFEAEKSPQDAGISTRKMRGNSVATAGGVLSSRSTSTNVPTTKDPQTAAVEGFLDWFIAAYPSHRDGRLCPTSNPATMEAAVRHLLHGRSVEQLQDMALAMWQDRTEPWLNRPDNDRSIFALRQKAAYLDARVAHLRKRDIGGHYPQCRTMAECRERSFREGKAAREAHG